MSGQVWVSLISLGGVALGGALSFLVQFATQRSAERTEQRRQQTELSEARRAERLTLLERFVEPSEIAQTLWSVGIYIQGRRMSIDNGSKQPGWRA